VRRDSTLLPDAQSRRVYAGAYDLGNSTVPFSVGLVPFSADFVPFSAGLVPFSADFVPFSVGLVALSMVSPSRVGVLAGLLNGQLSTAVASFMSPAQAAAGERRSCEAVSEAMGRFL